MSQALRKEAETVRFTAAQAGKICADAQERITRERLLRRQMAIYEAIRTTANCGERSLSWRSGELDFGSREALVEDGFKIQQPTLNNL